MSPGGGRAVLITGAGRGIGRALCLEGLRRGYAVHAMVRRLEDAPPGTTAHIADVRDRAAVRAIVKALAPSLDVFIANAGIGAAYNPRKESSIEKAVEVFDVNGTATAHSVYAVAHEWVRDQERSSLNATGGRRLAVVSSLAAGRGLPGNGAYCATKMAELVMCQSLDADLAPFGIGVSVIQPGFVESDMTKDLETAPFRMPAARAARIIWRGLERGRFVIAFPWPMRLACWLRDAVPYPLFRWAMRLASKLS